MEKRKWFYLEPPSHFEIPPCSCGNEDTQWSEYEKHLWCDKCNKDFIPEHGGIFDGPIPMNTAKMLGITFARYNIESKQILLLDLFWEDVVCHNPKNIFFEKKIPLDLKEKKSTSQTITHKALLNFSDGNIIIDLLSDPLQIISTELYSAIRIGYPKTAEFDLTFQFNQQNKSLNILNTDSYQKLKQYLLANELNFNMKINSKEKSSLKI